MFLMRYSSEAREQIYLAQNPGGNNLGISALRAKRGWKNSGIYLFPIHPVFKNMFLLLD